MPRRPISQMRSAMSFEQDQPSATPGRRLAAHTVDVVFVLASTVILPIVFAIMYGIYKEATKSAVNEIVSNVLFVLLWLIPVCLYYCAEASRAGLTPGKFYLGLGVCRIDGQPITILQSLLRTFIKLLLHLFPLPVLMCFFDKSRRAPQDLVGAQIVARTEQNEQYVQESAPIGLRFIAHVWDLIIVAICSCFAVLLTITLCIPFQLDSDLQLPIAGLVFLLAPLAYYVFFETTATGTPGKQCLGLMLHGSGPQRGISVWESLRRFEIKLANHTCPLLLLAPYLHETHTLSQDVSGIRVAVLPDFELDYTDNAASVWPRLFAHVLDLVIVVILLFFTAFFLVTFSTFRPLEATEKFCIYTTMLLLVLFAYFVCSDLLGGSGGKRMMRLGFDRPMTMSQAVSRFFIKLSMHLVPFLALALFFHPTRRLPQDLDGITIIPFEGKPVVENPIPGMVLAISAGLFIPIYFMTIPSVSFPKKDPAQVRAARTTVLTTKRQWPSKVNHKFKPLNAEVVYYQSRDKLLAWVVKPDNMKPGDKRPAILWAHGGEGLDPSDLRVVEPFLSYGWIVMLPSWRGENWNPGYYEMCFGEIDDAVAAVDYLYNRPDVDKDYIFAAGHSIGGTIALLLAENTDKLRKVAACGALTNMARPERASQSPGSLPVAVRLLETAVNAAKTENSENKARIGPYADIPCEPSFSELSQRSFVDHLNFLTCPVLLVYGDSGDDLKLAKLASFTQSTRDELNITHRKPEDPIPEIQQEAVPGDHFQALPNAVPRMIKFFLN